MKKSELKTNMLVKTRAGKFLLVKTNVFFLSPDKCLIDILVDDDRWISLDNYNEDLTCVDSLSPTIRRDFEIIEVYIPTPVAYRHGNEFDLSNYRIIWKQEEPIKEENSEVAQLCKEIEEMQKSLNDLKTSLAKTICKDDENIKKIKELLFAKSEERNMV
jgi:hypothetical protein